MTTIDDMRELRDALENVASGALPSWHGTTTILGDCTVVAAQVVIRKLHEQMEARYAAEEELAQVKRWLNDAHTHSSLLTRQVQALEAEVERLKAEQKRGVVK